MTTVRQILTDYLEKHGFEGLAGDGCGCKIEEMFDCDAYCGDCVPAYIHPGEEDYPYIMRPHKPEQGANDGKG